MISGQIFQTGYQQIRSQKSVELQIGGGGRKGVDCLNPYLTVSSEQTCPHGTKACVAAGSPW